MGAEFIGTTNPIDLKVTEQRTNTLPMITEMIVLRWIGLGQSERS